MCIGNMCACMNPYNIETLKAVSRVQVLTRATYSWTAAWNYSFMASAIHATQNGWKVFGIILENTTT